MINWFQTFSLSHLTLPLLRIGDKYTFESDGEGKDADRDAHTADGRRIVERERSALQGQEGNGKVGSGCPYYFELSKRDIGGAVHVESS